MSVDVSPVNYSDSDLDFSVGYVLTNFFFFGGGGGWGGRVGYVLVVLTVNRHFNIYK